MNLLTSAWIPVRLPDGSAKKLTPSEIPYSGAIEVAHPRADYNALITEMLVCLFQTLAAPVDEDQRLDYLDGLLKPDLAADTSAVSLFELAEGEYRFLQAPVFEAEDSLPAAALHFEVPTGSTVTKNNDFFVSRSAVAPVCTHCAPVALFLNQSHARMGGTGYRTGPRETSVLAALLEGRDLWHTICLNLQTADWFDSRTGQAEAALTKSFPWTRPEFFQKKVQVDLASLGRFGVLWWMPVALRLRFSTNTKNEACYACGEVHDQVASRFVKAATPAVLVGDTPHPHTGWFINPKTNVGRAQEVDKRGFYLEQWQALTVGAAAEHSLPAWQKLNFLDRDSGIRMHVFGYAMNQNKPLFWLDEVTPIVTAATPQQADDLRMAATLLLTVGRKAQAALSAALRPPKHANSNDPAIPLRTSIEQAILAYWNRVSSLAIAQLQGLSAQALEISETVGSTSFDEAVSKVALEVFDRAVECPPAQPLVARAVLQRRTRLIRTTAPKSSKTNSKK